MSHREHNRASSDIGGMRGAVPFSGLEHENRQMGDGYDWSHKYNVRDVDEVVTESSSSQIHPRKAKKVRSKYDTVRRS